MAKDLDPCVCGHPYGWHVIHGGACVVGFSGGGTKKNLRPVCSCGAFRSVMSNQIVYPDNLRHELAELAISKFAEEASLPCTIEGYRAGVIELLCCLRFWIQKDKHYAWKTVVLEADALYNQIIDKESGLRSEKEDEKES